MRSFAFGGEPIFIDFSPQSPDLPFTPYPGTIYDHDWNMRPLLATEILVIDSIYIDAVDWYSTGSTAIIQIGTTGTQTPPPYPVLWSINAGAGNASFSGGGFASNFWPVGIPLPAGVYPYINTQNNGFPGDGDGAAFCGIGRIIKGS